MGLLPIMFKLGVLSTIIVLTFFLSMKAVFLGVILLLINVGFIVAKVISHKSSYWMPDKNIDIHLHTYNPIPKQHDYSNEIAYQAYPPVYKTVSDHNTAWGNEDTVWPTFNRKGEYIMLPYKRRLNNYVS